MSATFWTAEGLAQACGGRVHGGADTLVRGKEARLVSGITQDTRALKPGMAYLAIQGERMDGHDFVAQAFAAGAACAVVEREVPGVQGPQIVVKSSVAALQLMARAWRQELAKGGCQVVAICGSNGKTTTRHLLHQVLTACGLPGTQSPKSFNNHLGVPLTLLAAKPTDTFVAAEIGTNHPGEIAALAQIASPDVALITSIGEEHLEFFKDLSGVAKEEAAVLSYLRPPGLAVIAAQAAAHTMPYERMSFQAVRQVVSPDAADPAIPAQLPMPGAHGRSNAALVAAVARHFGCADAAIHGALAQSGPAEGRWQTIPLGQGVTLIHDAYNANPSSVNAGLDTLAGPPAAFGCWPCGKPKTGAAQGPPPCMVVLGDMYELGEAGPDAHRAIAARVADTPSLRPAVFIGAEYAKQAGHLAGRPGIHVIPAFDEATSAKVAMLAEPGDTVWLKASRGMRLERLIPAFQQRFP